MDLFDLYQHGQIRRAYQQLQADASLNDHRHQSSRDELDQLHARIDRLLLINEAIWQLVCETTGLTDEHLIHRVHALDSVDGSVDGRRQAVAADCGSCGAKVHPRARRCQFCGADGPRRSLMDGV